jgi:hypothetical protein
VQVTGNLADVVSDLYGGNGISINFTGGLPHVAHFSGTLEGLDNLNQVVTANLGVPPLNSTSSSVTFDLSTGTVVQSEDALGPFFAERADTLGKGKFNFAASFTSIDFKRLDGTSLDNLALTFVHPDCCGGVPPTTPNGILGVPAFENDIVTVALDLTVRQEIFAAYASYGITDVWDVGVVFPYVFAEARASAVATIVDRGGNGQHTFVGSPDQPVSRTGGKEDGIGDIILRTKYRLTDRGQDTTGIAVIGNVSLPTGDEDNLLGSGTLRLGGSVVASRSFGDWMPHANVGFEWSSHSVDNNMRYVVGTDYKASARLLFTADILGRWVYDLDTVGNHTVDLGFGVKFDPFGVAPINAGILVPLNKSEGFRPNALFTIGIETTF